MAIDQKAKAKSIRELKALAAKLERTQDKLAELEQARSDMYVSARDNGCTYREIAAIFDITHGAVAQKEKRARVALEAKAG